MKKCVFVLLVVLIGSIGLEAAEESPLGATFRVDTTMSITGPNAIAPLVDGGFVYAGKGIHEDMPEAILYWTDQTGNETFRLGISEDYETYFSEMCLLDNGTVVALQDTELPCDVSSDAFSSRWDLVYAKDGAVIKTEPFPQKSYVSPSMFTVDSGFMIFYGERMELEAYDDTFYVNALEMRDMDGNIKWKSVFEDQELSLNSVLCLDDGYIMSGSRKEHDSGKRRSFGIVLKMDRSGNILWQKELPASQWLTLGDALLGADGNLYASGSHVLDSSKHRDIFPPRCIRICLSPSGEWLWLNEYEEGDNVFHMFDIKATDDGFMGLVSWGKMRSPVRLALFDMEEHIIAEWPVKRHASRAESSLSLVETADGLYIVEYLHKSGDTDEVYMTPVYMNTVQ